MCLKKMSPIMIILDITKSQRDINMHIIKFFETIYIRYNYVYKTILDFFIYILLNALYQSL